MNLLLKLFLAHLIGDFVLQPAAWVKSKEKKKLASWQLYGHSILHGLLVLLLLWDLQDWNYAVVIAIGHCIIDSLKLVLQNDRNRRWLFFLDQLIHVILIYGVWLWLGNRNFPFAVFQDKEFLLLVTGMVFLTTPVSFGVKIFISKWTPEPQGQDAASLQSAGKYIGFIERLLVFIFIVINQWAAVGFLLAAKSIFRFGDLKEARDRKLTEYVLIGTLLSFATAIVTALLLQLAVQ